MSKLLMSMFVAATLACCDAEAQYSERINVRAIEIPALVRDSKGHVPEDLKPGDFRLLEDGIEQTIIGVTYPRPPLLTIEPATTAAPEVARPHRGEVVIYLQQWLVTTYGLRAAFKSLAEEAGHLAQTSEVEVISDFPSPHVVMARTHDADALRQFFVDLSRRGIGHQQQLNLRFAAMREDPRTLTRISATSLAAASLEEQLLVRRAQNQFLTWMARYPRVDHDSSRILILVSDGFDVDTNYGQQLRDITRIDSGVPADHGSDYLARDQDSVSKALGAQGWTVICLAAGHLWSLTTTTSSVEVSGPAHNRLPPMPAARPLMAKALDPLHSLAGETGGMVETSAARLRRDLEDLDRRVIITYQVNRLRDGKLRRIDLRATRPGLSIHAPRWSILGTPEATAAARATSLALGNGEVGELPVTCRMSGVRGNPKAETMDATVDVGLIGALRRELHSASLRFSIAVTPRDALPFTATQTLDKLDLASSETWQTTFPINDRRGAPIAVVAEELSTGAWGGAVCSGQ